MKKRNVLRKMMAGCMAMGLLFLTACSSGTTQGSGTDKGIQQRVIKAGIGLNEDHPEGQGLLKFKEIVEQKSGGKLKVQTYFSATLGDDLKMTEALQAGTQEITIPSTSPLVGIMKEFGIFDFPFLFNTSEEADAILDGPIGQKLLEKLPEYGLIGLGYWENGFRHVTNSKRAIETADDFKGLKLRTMQNEVHIDAFKELGANPTPMPFSEVFTALESHTIDGQENPLATIKSNKFYEVQKHLSLTKHVYTPFVFLVSKKFWDTLSSEEQKILQEAAIEAGKYQRQLSREEDQKALDELKKTGVKINEISDQERQKMAEIIQPVVETYAKKFGDDLVNELYNELDKIRQ
ncbi:MULTISPECIES: TRAP transporter substrate-binding protein [Geobacillus]|jgi:tripartite ATP-independent transporter DctP family solute receptor|uniref:TRAP transporter substrate-binding protein n=1 Tax=Geobacillus thermodenitrificans TaxID=33940 RepID=A0ABY9Q957_GEOTD|nr:MULTISPECIES: TRAP transporter substrate-binding protein [Geobacillus]KQB93104.1 ABC transporter substrate-binding protein [Geobacillus sp. PA-3]MED3907395.1 TRAP transporter substrate-binding protein [Geobacillus thermodenitrificans]WMV74796.1 TRAP transporter substrate-binding protein [Geobacillus thermodenitrificans]